MFGLVQRFSEYENVHFCKYGTLGWHPRYLRYHATFSVPIAVQGLAQAAQGLGILWWYLVTKLFLYSEFRGWIRAPESIYPEHAQRGPPELSVSLSYLLL